MRRAGRLARLVAVVAGWVVLVAGLDLLVGSALGVDDQQGVGGRVDLVDLGSGRAGDLGFSDLADAPAMRDVPWVEEYWAEFDALRFRPQAYAESAASDQDGTYIDVVGGVRRSYEQAGVQDGEDVPEVWFFGGSTTWGQGQRDEHTIPSEVARLAEDEGIRLRVVNHGMLGDTSWQEVNRFVAALAARPAPQVVVFYDGANDLAVHTEDPSGQPSLYDRDQRQAPPSWAEGAEVRPTTLLDEWWEVSLLGKVLRRTVGIGPAGANEEGDPAVAAEQVPAIYRRARDLSTTLAEEAGAEPVFFAQPLRGGFAAELAERFGEPTIDITGAFDGVADEEVYLDAVHTNEAGARLVAEAMWPHIRAALTAPPLPGSDAQR